MHLHKCGAAAIDLLRHKIKKCISDRIKEMVLAGLIQAVEVDGQIEYIWREDADNFLGVAGWNRDWSREKGDELAGRPRAVPRATTQLPARQPTRQPAPPTRTGGHDRAPNDNDRIPNDGARDTGPKGLSRGLIGYEKYHGIGQENQQTVTPHGFYGGHQVVANAGGSVHVHLTGEVKSKRPGDDKDDHDKMDIDPKDEPDPDPNVDPPNGHLPDDFDDGKSTYLWPLDFAVDDIQPVDPPDDPRPTLDDNISEFSFGFSDADTLRPSDSMSQINFRRNRLRPSIPPPIPEEDLEPANEPSNIGPFPKPASINLRDIRAEMEACTLKELEEAFDKAASMAIYLANL